MDTPVFNVHDLILIMTFAVSGALVLFQPIVPYSNRLTKILLAIFYLCIAVDAVCLLLLWSEYIKYGAFVADVLPYFLVVAALTKGVTLYFYVITVTKENFSFNQSHFVHFIPAVICVGLLLGFKIDSHDLLFDDDMSFLLEHVVHVLWYAIKITPICYAVAAVVSLRQYREQLLDQYSTISDPAIIWLNYLTIGFLCSWVWTLFVNILGNCSNLEVVGAFGVADNYITFFLVIALFAYSISYVQTLLKTSTEIKPAEEIQKPNEAIIEKIRYGVEIQKLYLNQSINIEDFSKEIGAPFREVSNAINKHFQTNFFEFINNLRVEEAKRMLADRSYDKLSILDILHESGFNSKSAFQRFFKRLTGVSPREFRKNAYQEGNSE
jgi:AraC-like DNA-binding protein